MKRFLLALPLAALGAAWFWFLILPWPVPLRWRDPGRTAFMEQRQAEARAAGDSLGIRHSWKPLSAISERLQRAVIIAEDGRFYKHAGVDWAAVGEELDYTGDGDFSPLSPADLGHTARALRYYLEHRAEIRGRSTITQQLAKNLYFSADRSLLRKVKELLVAKRLERFLSKDRILEIYLNVAEWGPGIFGAEAAAQHYFGRSAADLTMDQAAALAATLPHPLSSNPARNPGRMAWRKNLILRQLGSGGPPETVPLAPPEVLGTEVDVPDLDTRPEPPPEVLPPPRDSAADTLAPPPPSSPPDTASPPDTLRG
ncbi:MAG TPA: biosynthetic peptidoglycan transglycosylase [Longimicrobiales bacterium]|nr:biosynthetic peptidoglycan transglycosylase [Longimicrobiales bacterium]